MITDELRGIAELRTPLFDEVADVSVDATLPTTEIVELIVSQLF